MFRIITSIVAFFSITAIFAQNPTGEVPKLVVGITIDQLRGDYLEMFKSTFGNKGFNRLLNNGLVYKNVNYDFPYLDKASTITSIFTGANPSYHGITAEKKFLLANNIEISSFHDDNYLGNFTTEKLSPLSIKVLPVFHPQMHLANVYAICMQRLALYLLPQLYGLFSGVLYPYQKI
jgi:hypothetical protein